MTEPKMVQRVQVSVLLAHLLHGVFYIPPGDERVDDVLSHITSGEAMIQNRATGEKRAVVEDEVFDNMEFALLTPEAWGCSPKARTRRKAKEVGEYQLTITGTQGDVINRALDLYYRLMMGQLGEIAAVMRHRSMLRGDSFGAIDWRRVDDLLAELKGIVFPTLGSAFYGIASPEVPDEAKKMCDLRDVIRHCIAWDRNPEGGHTTNFNDPMKHGSEPLAKMKRTHG